MSNRHLARTMAMQTLFTWDFNGRKTDADVSELIKIILKILLRVLMITVLSVRQ